MVSGNSLDVDGHRISVTNLEKVLYPATGTRKFDVIDYYNRVAEVMLPHLAGRIITRKRWPNGVESTPFFEKDLPGGTPEWIHAHGMQHSSRVIRYPLAGSRADLVWMAQMAALELHTPQWRLPDVTANRLVLDLDPGPGVPLTQCAQVACEIKDMLDAAGLDAYPVTSGGKGLHVYARFTRPVAPDSARTVAKQIATSLAAAHPDSVTASMSKTVRDKRVFIDWSQNSASKTTLSPYSLRGREQPWVAAPRAWSELTEPDLAQLLFHDVLDRIDDVGDLLGTLDDPYDASSPTTPPSETEVINLREYRSKRSKSKTPEPFGDENHRARADDIERPSDPIFVIQEHHARRLHYDFRLERDGVLVSWAVPKNLPVDTDQNRLAIHTEDHPMDYADFDGDIPHGEYGGGHVEIWDRGTYETEKWRDDEVIVRLHGTKIQGRYALIRTGDKNWLAHLMSDEPRPIMPDSLRDPRPMLATDESIDSLDGATWAFEGKWDGYRILLRYIDGEFRLTSRSGIDMTDDFPELRSIADDLGLLDVVLDGEVVAIDSSGRTNFTLLSGRNTTDEPHDVKFFIFDVLYLNGRSLLRTPWSARREVLDELAPAFRGSSDAEIPPLLPGPGSAAIEYSREHGLEGVVAKKRSSTYQQGRRVTTWLKHKNWSDIEVVVGGYRLGRGNRASTIGSLLLGLPEETGLRYVGRVGTGFTDAQLRSLVNELEPLRINTCPFLDKLDRPVASSAVWVLPKIVGEVRFMDWTSTGHLRHPSWRGIRRDKLPGDL